MNELQQQVEDLQRYQLSDWKLASDNYAALGQTQTRMFEVNDFHIILQYNPERIRSSAAKIDAASLQKRPCFFCNRPEEQQSIPYRDSFRILVNPYPIFEKHLTVPALWHDKQQILPYYEDMLSLAADFPDYVIFYNGPKCGASAPDHMHFQAVGAGSLPIEWNWTKALKEIVWRGEATTLYVLYDFLCPVFMLASSNRNEAVETFEMLYAQLEIKEGDYEPMMNVVTWMEENVWYSFIFPRKELRPSCFYAVEPDNILISPATVEMAGFFVAPLEKDFQKITAKDLECILKEVAITKEQKDEIVRKIRAL